MTVADGKFFIHNPTHDFYLREDGAWVLKGNIGKNGDAGFGPPPASPVPEGLYLDISTGDVYLDGGIIGTLPGGASVGPAGADGISIPGRDGEDGEDAWPIPGQPGQSGADGESIIGPAGADGRTIPGTDGEDGDSWPIPGQSGIDGADGRTIPGLDGEDGDSWPIPGQPGADGESITGPAGVDGRTIPGTDGEDGDSWPIPGRPGVDGVSLVGAPGRDGEDCESWPIPGRPGVDGQSPAATPGRDGEDGADGFPIPGAVGRPGGFRFIFNSSTSAADPGTGKFALSNTVASFAATTLWINRTSADGNGLSVLFGTILNSGVAALVIFKSVDASKVIALSVTAGTFVDNSTWYAVTITPQTAPTGVTNGMEFYLDVVRYGADGTNGAGVPTGGTGGQFLKKNTGVNYDTSWVDFPARQPILTGIANYYVNPLGSDSNSGNIAQPFLTIQKAIDVVGTLDLAIYGANINVADGTYTGPVLVNGPFVGSGVVTIIGNASSPGNVLLSVSASDYCMRAQNGAAISIVGVKLRNSTVGFKTQLSAIGGAVIRFDKMHFDTCDATSGRQMIAAQGASIVANGGLTYSITGGAGWHIFCSAGGNVNVEGATVTLVGTPAFGQAFAAAWIAASCFVDGMTFSGTATGKRYDAESNGVVFVGGQATTYLPGNVAGTTLTGGQYV